MYNKQCDWREVFSTLAHLWAVSSLRTMKYHFCLRRTAYSSSLQGLENANFLMPSEIRFAAECFLVFLTCVRLSCTMTTSVSNRAWLLYESFLSGMWWHLLAVPAFWEAEVGGSQIETLFLSLLCWRSNLVPCKVNAQTLSCIPSQNLLLLYDFLNVE